MKNPKIKKHLLVSTFLLSFFLLSLITLIRFSSPAPAQATESDLWKTQTGVSEIGFQAFGNDKPKDVRVITANVVKVFLGFLGIIFLVLLITAGFKYMTAAGNEEKVKEALSQIQTAVIGLIIIASSYAVASYITSCVLDVTNESQTWMCQRET